MSKLAHTEPKSNGNLEYVENLNADKGSDHLYPGQVDESLVVIEGEDKINGYTSYLGFIAGLSGFLFGWDTAIIGGALSNIGTALNGKVLSSTEQEWAVASLSVGALFGALLGGTYADIWGRKPVLIIGDVNFIVGAILLCASRTLVQFIVGRVVMGFGVGIAAVVCAVYIGEVAPTKLRGRLVSIQSVMITGGQMLAYCVAAGLDNVKHGWIIMFAISIPFALGQGIGMHYLPDSPRFDIVKGNQERARRTLAQIYKNATPEQIELKLKVIQVSADVSNSLKRQHPSIWVRIRIALTTGRYFRCILASTGLFIFQQFAGSNTLMYYGPTLFKAVGFNNATAVGILFSGVNALMSVISMFTMDPVGRRRIFLVGTPIIVFSLGMAAIAFWQMTKPTGGFLVVELASEYSKKWVGLMIGMLVLFFIGYAPSLGTIAYTSIELIPLEVRGIGSAIAISWQWGANIIISATYLTIMNSIGPAGAYGLYAAIQLLGVIFIYFTYPEPSGLSLEETATLFDEGFGVKKSQEFRAAHRSFEHKA